MSFKLVESWKPRLRSGSGIVLLAALGLGLAWGAPTQGAQANAVVAADGSGTFTTVQAAVDAAPTNSAERFVIHLKPGIYREQVLIPPSRRKLCLQGEDAATTVIRFNLSSSSPGPEGQGIGTFQTPSVRIQADDFAAENITFENSFGKGTQAVAVAVSGDRVAFRKCRFLGWQDTLLAQSGRQYYEDCYLAGHVDFIFGSATAYFERCQIHCLADGYITAASTPQQQPFGFVFNHCRITAENGQVKTFLGRPWRPYASVAFLNTEMAEAVRLEGWNNWRDPAREKTVRFCEFHSTGPGAQSDVRVPWAYELSAKEAKTFSLEGVLGGLDGWNPKTGKVHAPFSVVPAGRPAADSVASASTNRAGEAFLFSTFRGNGQRGLMLAYSFDGYHWTNFARSFLIPKVGTAGILRDPSLLCGPDGVFRLVWTCSWHNEQGFGYASSSDLVHWSEQKWVSVMTSEPEVANVWAPELFYDGESRQYIILWASGVPGRFPDYLEQRGSNFRLFYTTTTDFEHFSDSRLLFDAGYSAIDGFIVQDGKRFVLLNKDNSRPYRCLRLAFADHALGPWSQASDALTEEFCEGPSALKVGEDWLIFYDAYRAGSYGALRTRDFRHFTNISSLVVFPKGHKHGTPLRVPRSVVEALLKAQS